MNEYMMEISDIKKGEFFVNIIAESIEQAVEELREVYKTDYMYRNVIISTSQIK